jgi:hypothetical protein
MNREQLIKWLIKNPEIMTEFLEKLITEAEFRLMIDEVIKKQNKIKYDN